MTTLTDIRPGSRDGRPVAWSAMVRLFDTLIGREVELVTREPDKITMYVCGPTVYDAPHVGHGRMALCWDVIRRYLAWRGYEVTFVSNVTDIEDKIIRRAAETGSTEGEVSRHWEAVYFDAMDRLGIDRPDHVPHATEYVERMVAFIADLVERGRAYVIEGMSGGVYFAVDSIADYGALVHRSVDELLESAGARVDVDERKRSPLDFALWKAGKPGEPTWPSPWGDGRPGWHIECSVMSLDLLDDGFDLHGGGNDLVFPHHENERAQALGADRRFARHWAHSGMVTVGGDGGVGEKMSKSLGNFTTLLDVLERQDPRALRVAVLQSHYRSAMLLGPSEIAAAERTLESMDAHARKARAAGLRADSATDSANMSDSTLVQAFREAMDADFNTPQAFAVIAAALTRANTAIDGGDLQAAAPLVAAVSELCGAVGLVLDDGIGSRGAGRGEALSSVDATSIDALVADRDAARARRDFAASDAIRDRLASLGVRIEDTPTGTIWFR